MIFSPELAELVISGRKTVTRRPVKWDLVEPPLGIVPTGPHNRIAEEGKAKDCRYRVGRFYAVQPGRGKKAVGHIWIESVEMQALSAAFHHAEARAEGFTSSAGFKKHWLKLYGAFDPDQPVWRIAFHLIHPDDEPLWEGS